jgi:outer membrane protein assembly factor BamD
MNSDQRRHDTPGAAWRLLLLAVCLLTPLAACKSGPKTDPILRLSAQEALERGKELMGDEKYFRAREFLTHAYEVEPNSVAGREGLILAADSLYLEGGRSNLVQAEARYRDFINRFPTSDRAPYAQFQIANSLAQRMGRPDRDLSATEEALTAYQDLIRLYPTSEYAAQAREKTRLVKENLAEHEFMIGDFYLRYRLPPAAASRFEYLLDNYPAYSEKDKVLYKLGVAYLESRQPDKARETFERLEREYPQSEYLAELPEVPEPESQEAAEGEAKAAADGSSDEGSGTAGRPGETGDRTPDRGEEGDGDDDRRLR